MTAFLTILTIQISLSAGKGTLLYSQGIDNRAQYSDKSEGDAYEHYKQFESSKFSIEEANSTTEQSLEHAKA